MRVIVNNTIYSVSFWLPLLGVVCLKYEVIYKYYYYQEDIFECILHDVAISNNVRGEIFLKKPYDTINHKSESLNKKEMFK